MFFCAWITIFSIKCFLNCHHNLLKTTYFEKKTKMTYKKEIGMAKLLGNFVSDDV